MLAPYRLCLACALVFAAAQAQAAEPRTNPPRPAAGNAESGSTSADGYTPLPQWAGQTRAPVVQKSEAYDVEVVASGVSNGFAFAFLPDGNILFTERPGKMRIAYRDGRSSEPLTGLPQLWTQGPQGLLDVDLDKDFATNRVIYFSFTAPPEPLADPAPRLAGVQRVARARLAEDLRSIDQVKILLNTEGIEGRLVQARDGSLFVTSGVPAGVGIVSAEWPQPQQLDSGMGKVLHIGSDGSIPKDNPFVGRADALPAIYAIGLREDQGLAFDPRTGNLWASSNGPKGGDELNIIRRGKNYGFPIISYGHEYSGKPINGNLTAKEGMEQPIYFWTPSIAPSGIEFYTGSLFPAWKGDLFVASLAQKYLVRLVLDAKRTRIVGEERLLAELDTSFRDVHTGPDGALYVMTKKSTDGEIVKLVPRRGR